MAEQPTDPLTDSINTEFGSFWPEDFVNTPNR
jgi:hypothetical protein